MPRAESCLFKSGGGALSHLIIAHSIRISTILVPKKACRYSVFDTKAKQCIELFWRSEFGYSEAGWLAGWLGLGMPSNSQRNISSRVCYTTSTFDIWFDATRYSSNEIEYGGGWNSLFLSFVLKTGYFSISNQLRKLVKFGTNRLRCYAWAITN